MQHSAYVVDLMDDGLKADLRTPMLCQKDKRSCCYGTHGADQVPPPHTEEPPTACQYSRPYGLQVAGFKLHVSCE